MNRLNWKDQLSGAHQKSIHRIKNLPNSEKHCYYVHEFVTEEYVYGSIVQSPKKLRKNEIVEQHNKKFASCFCREFKLTHTISFVPDECNTDDDVQFVLLYDSDLPSLEYVSVTYGDLTQLAKLGVKFYCDYQDQGFDEIEDFDAEYQSYEEFIENTLRDSEADNDDCVQYCAGESVFVKKEILEQLHNKEN